MAWSVCSTAGCTLQKLVTYAILLAHGVTNAQHVELVFNLSYRQSGHNPKANKYP